MGERRLLRSKTITKAQAIGILALTLALLLIVSFAAKSVELYRLEAWRAQLGRDIAEMQRQVESLKLEKQRRESMAWVDEALRETGRVPSNIMVVTVVDATPVVAPAAASTPAQHIEPQDLVEKLFRNPNWEAWKKLIRQKD